MVPRRDVSDYDEDEATTLDPFALHESELVVVPRAGTDAMREELKADPDVQDALRWLDPPSNAGPPAAAAAAAATAAAVATADAAYQPQYTPLPQPYPGPGPYPTPVPAYVPNSGAYYLATPLPQPVPPAPAPARSPLLWILVSAIVTGGGIALGWWMFSGRYSSQAAGQPAVRAAATPTAPAATPTPPAPAATPTPPAPAATPTPPAPAATPTPPAPAASGPITAKVASIVPTNTAPIKAPVGGTISKIFLSAAGKVAKGDKLVEIRTESSGGAKAKKLAARVAELEQLAQDDPVYEEFLADARKAERAARGTAKLTVVKAPGAGHAQVDVKEGAAVARGAPIGQIASGGDWIVKATAAGEVLRSWTCSVALGEGDSAQKAPCKIDKVVATAAGSDISATVSPKDAPWLEAAVDRAGLLLAPP